MSRALVRALRARSVDVRTALDEEMIERSDEEHLAFAASLGRVLYTFNTADFVRIHTEFVGEGRKHAGIVLAQQQRFSVGGQMRLLLRLIGSRSSEEMVNRIEFLSAWSGMKI